MQHDAEAKELLLDDNSLTIVEIADKVGFKSVTLITAPPFVPASLPILEKRSTACRHPSLRFPIARA
jgi:AraC-like DNA-binding protein